MRKGERRVEYVTYLGGKAARLEEEKG